VGVQGRKGLAHPQLAAQSERVDLLANELEREAVSRREDAVNEELGGRGLHRGEAGVWASHD
jgi:hypothetical protein